MCVAQPLEHALVSFEGPDSHTTREHDDVGLGKILEGGIHHDAEHPVVASHLAPLVADEGHVNRRDPLKHFVRPDAVKGSEAREQGDGDLDGLGHAGVLS